MATSQTRARPRKAGTTKAAKAPATSRKPAAAAKKAPAKKAAAKKPAAAKKSPARKTPAALGAARSFAQAGPSKGSNKPKAKVARVLDAAERLRTLVLDALDDLKAKDVAEIDVRGKSGVTDLLVIASGTSSRHVKSIADEVVKKAKQAGVPPIGVEGQREAEWVLVDLGDVIVHVMLPRTREFYGLERLWTVGDHEAPAKLAG